MKVVPPFPFMFPVSITAEARLNLKASVAQTTMLKSVLKHLDQQQTVVVQSQQQQQVNSAARYAFPSTQWLCYRFLFLLCACVSYEGRKEEERSVQVAME